MIKFVIIGAISGFLFGQLTFGFLGLVVPIIFTIVGAAAGVGMYKMKNAAEAENALAEERRRKEEEKRRLEAERIRQQEDAARQKNTDVS